MIVALAKGLGTKWTVLVPLPLARLMPRRTCRECVGPPTNGFTSYGCDNREPGCLTTCRCFVITAWNWKWPRGFHASNLESKYTFFWKTLRNFDWKSNGTVWSGRKISGKKDHLWTPTLVGLLVYQSDQLIRRVPFDLDNPICCPVHSTDVGD